jgi:hypothetical protein
MSVPDRSKLRQRPSKASSHSIFESIELLLEVRTSILIVIYPSKLRCLSEAEEGWERWRQQ